MRRRGAGTQGRSGIKGRAARCLTAFLVIVTFCAPAPLRLSAQTPDSLTIPRVAPAIRYGKWVALGGAVGLGVLAARKHDDANTAYNTLRARCDATPEGCLLSGGTYVDPVNEALYQRTRRLDHQAARCLVGTETLSATAALGFLWELYHHTGAPKNIPFDLQVAPGATSTRVTVALSF